MTMRTLAVAIAALTFLLSTAQVPAREPRVDTARQDMGACAPLGKAYSRTTLYFGLTRPTGIVSEAEWRTFLRGEVIPRFPQGLTVWEADGQWRRSDGRIARERAKVLLLVHEDSTEVRAALGAIVTGYKGAFQQESVLWETSPVCAAF
jgi:hypothetical protein